ncbi:hypothetical protein Moror_7285 [Moniliophthora roreri MCA 2997]|uniref:DUF6534 domain-containing protein n=1 Tax=Moniliophthora roreri (strain MCA 2997) TaxID=1381753 RepID=V2YWT2_MONRO|nr:hypothetical protein Moror_7285 [Moniliophthora roreri MCA 2997]
MSAPPSGPPLPEPESITASVLLGALFNWALLGVLGCQTYLYHIYFPNDKAAFKCLVYGVFLFETAQSAMTAHDTYIWLSKGFGDFLNLTKVLTSPLNTPMMGAIIALIVQLFYTHRIWTLRKSWLWFCVFLVAITLAQTGAAFHGGIQALRAGNFLVQTDASNRHGVYVWLIGEAVADALIAAAMVYLMILNQGQNHQFQSYGILARVVIITVESNCATGYFHRPRHVLHLLTTVTASLAILSLTLFAFDPVTFSIFPDLIKAHIWLQNTNYFICPTLVLGKIYANTLLVSFNNRIILRNLSQSFSFSTGSTTTPSSPPPWHRSTPSSAKRIFDSSAITYTVERFTETDSPMGKMEHELQETPTTRDVAARV